MIWATVSSRSCFCWLYSASPSLAAKNIINLISVLTIWVMLMCRVFSCVVGRGCLLWPVCFLGKTLLGNMTCFILYSKAKFVCYSRYLLISYFCIPVPYDEKDIFLSVSSRRSDQPWDFFGRNEAKAETPVLWPPHAKSWLIGKNWCCEGLGAGGKGDDRGWDGWMASLTRWTWVWVNSGSWWWTGRPGVLQFMGLQRVGRAWATELNWTDQDAMILQKLTLNECWNEDTIIQ